MTYLVEIAKQRGFEAHSNDEGSFVWIPWTQGREHGKCLFKIRGIEHLNELMDLPAMSMAMRQIKEPSKPLTPIQLDIVWHIYRNHNDGRECLCPYCVALRKE